VNGSHEVCRICPLVPQIEPIGTQPSCQPADGCERNILMEADLQPRFALPKQGTAFAMVTRLGSATPKGEEVRCAERERERERAPRRPSVRRRVDKGGAWTSTDLARLIAGDKATWDRAAEAIGARVAAASRLWGFSTLQSDAVRDHVEDVLLANGMRRLREFRDPGGFPAYLAKVARARASYVANHRPSAVSLPLGDVAETRFRRIADARPHPVFPPLAGSPAAYDAALCRAILRFRRALTDGQFGLLWLYHVDGRSTTEIASALKITPRGARKLHNAAILAIRRARFRHSAKRTPARPFRPGSPTRCSSGQAAELDHVGACKKTALLTFPWVGPGSGPIRPCGATDAGGSGNSLLLAGPCGG
jgi:DNA-directed RNA polymerase specialized sigma24 family protein